MDRKILKLFLKAGFIELNSKYETEIGFPQGSLISPALAGLETFPGKEFLCTRYVDDFVVLGKSRIKYLTNNIIITSKTRTKLITRQKGICPVCNTSLLNNEELHIHHIKPKRLKGLHKLNNLLLLHKDCHKQVEYSTDISLQAAFVKDGIIQKK